MKIHHIGIACTNIEEAIIDFGKIHTIISKSEIVFDPQQNAKLCMIKSDIGLDFEFIAGEQVVKLLKKGITYYHICYEVDNIDNTVEELKSKDAVIISEPKPAILFKNKRVAFLYLSYGLVELVEK
jgi:methylmalonyl-CoA/ethylmalonyl-CoA epimerase